MCMVRLLCFACEGAEKGNWQLALLFSTLPTGRVMAAAGRRHHALHPRSRGCRRQSSSASLEAHLDRARLDAALWAISASRHDGDPGPGRPPAALTRAMRFVWYAWAVAQPTRCAFFTVVRLGRMPSALCTHAISKWGLGRCEHIVHSVPPACSHATRRLWCAFNASLSMLATWEDAVMRYGRALMPTCISNRTVHYG